MDWKNYWRELKRRNVIKAGLAYLIVAWLVTQVLSIVLPTFEAPPFVLKTVLALLGIGFPIWLVFSWVYEFTPDGIKKTTDISPDASIMPKTGSKLNKVIILTLAIAVVVLIIDKFTQSPVKVVDYGEKSIAVLAFADMSPDKDHEYFSDGISEELLNLLAKIPDLKVISRTSSFSYKGKSTQVTEIGKELNVSHVLEGSIRKAGNMVRITAQLINTSDGSHEWSHTYDRNLDSIFKIQDEIASEVSKQLEIKILGRQNSDNLPSTEAYNLYLQAKHLFRQNTKASFITAKEIIKQSILIDSTYSNSWDLLASIYNSGYYNFSIGEAQETINKAMVAVDNAIVLNPNSANAYATRASLQIRLWNFEESAKNMAKALELRPNDATIIGTAALYTFGNLDKTVDLLNKAISLDPLVYVNFYNLGHAKYRLGDLDEAMEAFNTFEIYYPNSQILHYMKAKVYLAQGNFNEAKNEIEQETHEFFSLYGKNFVYHAMGNHNVSDSLFDVFKEKYSKEDPSNLADLYAFRGDIDKSFEWLEKAYEVRDAVLLEALSYPSFKPMYKDVRWNSLILKMNLPKNHGYPLN